MIILCFVTETIMKRILFIALSLLCIITASAQRRVAVLRESFNPNEMTARVMADQRQDKGRDHNGRQCALVVVEGVDDEQYLFDTGNTYCRAEKSTDRNGDNIVYLWVSDGTKRLDIKHRDRTIEPLSYVFDNAPLRGLDTYHLVMDRIAAAPRGGKQMLIFQVTPPTAMVEVEETPGTFMAWDLDATGNASKLMNMGRYNYRVTAPNYHPDFGFAEVYGRNEPTLVNANLRPNFGYLCLNTQLLSDATIYVDGVKKTVGEVENLQLATGQHEIKIFKPLYKPFNSKISITDGKTTAINPDLKPNFATIALSCPLPAAQLYLRTAAGDEPIADPSQLRLSPDTYIVVAKAVGHKESEYVLKVGAANKHYNFSVPAPTPQYGALHITSNAHASRVFVDGTLMGTAPLYLNEVLAGPHSIEVNADGYIPYSTTLNIAPNQENALSAQLNNNMEIDIDVANARSVKVYEDGNIIFPSLHTTRYKVRSGAVISIYASPEPGYEDFTETFTATDARPRHFACERTPENYVTWGSWVLLEGGYNTAADGLFPFSGLIYSHFLGWWYFEFTMAFDDAKFSGNGYTGYTFKAANRLRLTPRIGYNSIDFYDYYKLEDVSQFTLGVRADYYLNHWMSLYGTLDAGTTYPVMAGIGIAFSWNYEL